MQYIDVLIFCHDSVNAMKAVYTRRAKCTPQHYRATSMFIRWDSQYSWEDFVLPSYRKYSVNHFGRKLILVLSDQRILFQYVQGDSTFFLAFLNRAFKCWGFIYGVLLERNAFNPEERNIFVTVEVLTSTPDSLARFCMSLRFNRRGFLLPFLSTILLAGSGILVGRSEQRRIAVDPVSWNSAILPWTLDFGTFSWVTIL